MGTEGVLVHNAYSAATVETIKATLGANANKWTSFVDRVVRMNVPIAQRAKLYDEISKITNQGDLVKFLDEFEAIEAFRKGIIGDIDLIETFTSIRHLHNVKTDIVFLQKLREVLTHPKLRNHLLGEIVRGEAKGWHIFDATRMRIDELISGTLTKPIKAKISIKDANGIFARKTNGASTFFPDSWDMNKILEEIAFVYSKPTNITANPYLMRGFTYNGLLEIEIKLTGLNKIIDSAFPK